MKKEVIKVNVYDFDNTIYKGESALDFYFFCVRKHPLLIKFVFVVVVSLVKYKLCMLSEENLMKLCKRYVKQFIEGCPDIDELASLFWKKHRKNIKKFYHEIHKDDDVIVSASFDFLLQKITPELGVHNLICTEIDLESKEVVALCFKKNKKELFMEKYGDAVISEFYTDSLNDLPLIQMATEGAYIVKGNKISPYKGEKK